MEAELTYEDAEFLDDIGLDRDGEHKTVADDDADGGAWNP